MSPIGLLVGQIQALITADKGQFSNTVKQADAERAGFVAKSSKDKARIDADEKPFTAATQRATTAAGVMRSKIGSSFEELRGEFLKISAVAGVVEGIREIVMAASDLNESSNAINVTFRGAEKTVLDFTATASKTIGQSNTQAREAAATFGVYGKQAGLAADENAAFSISLVKLASDMASFRNTSPQEAIEAIGAALRGESDPIEQYGVLLTEAVLQQRALKMGVIQTTSQALTPQQRVLVAYQEILAQTKDAQGDFGRTSGELANQMRTLKAQVIDQAASMGQALLPAAKNVVGFLQGPGVAAFTAVGAVLKAIVGVVGQVIGAWNNLPAPIQAALLAMVAYGLASDGVRSKLAAINSKVQEQGGFLAALREKFTVVDDMAGAYTRAETAVTNWGRAQSALAAGLSGVNEEMTATQRATLAAGDGLSRVAGVASGAASAAFTGLRSAASGLIGFLGGPWGIALGAATVFLTMWISKQQAAAQAAAQHAAKVRSLTQDIQANSGALSAQAKAQQVAEARAKGLYDVAQRIGVSQKTMTEAILGNVDAIGQVNHAWDAAAGSFHQFGVETNDLPNFLNHFNGFMGISRDHASLLAEAMVNARNSFGDLSGGMIEATGAARENSGALEEVGVKAEDLAPKAQEATAALSPMADAVSKLGKTAISDADKISALKDALDDFAGKKHTAEEAAQAVNDALRDLGQAFKDAEADAKAHHGSLLTDAGAISTVTEKGSALQDKIMDIADAYRQQFSAAEEAAVASGKSLPEAMIAAANATSGVRQRFIDAAKAAGLNATEAANLAAKYDLIPSNVATQLTQPGMMQALLDTLGLGKNIRDIPNQWQTVLSSTAPAQIALMEQLGFKVTHLPNGDVLVSVNDADAWARINAITSPKTVRINLVASGLSGAALAGAMHQLGNFAGGGAMPANPIPRAVGGGVRSKLPYLVGELGPELVWPDRSGYVSTARQTAQFAAMLDRIDRRMIPSRTSLAAVAAGGGYAPGEGAVAGSVGKVVNYPPIVINGPDADAVARKVIEEIRMHETLYGM